VTALVDRPPAVGGFDHLVAMSDEIGTFEHADHEVARRSHGYCTDDMARVLIAVAREPQPGRHVLELGRLAFRFLADAQGVTGLMHNRRSTDGRWEDRRCADDCWGRSVWAFGTAARFAPEYWMRESALAYFEHGIDTRSKAPRAMAFAALGAAEVLAVEPKHCGARRVLADAVTAIGSASAESGWPWPEARLSYANAVLPEALLVAGVYLARSDVVADGLELLRWLLERETVAGHLSPTPSGGAGPADRSPAFDQQPIEVAAMADACARAAAVTGDADWTRGVERAAAWFAGDNDAGVLMWDPVTGGGYDGLEASAANQNQGTESTIALISTLQHLRAPVAASG
jgi:hypothetical protein